MDEAARRRFNKRLHVPLPDPDAREALVRRLLRDHAHTLRDADFARVVAMTDGARGARDVRGPVAFRVARAGYSGADISLVCREAAMDTLRCGLAGASNIDDIRMDVVPAVTMAHFENALRSVPPSVAPSELAAYAEWDRKFGSKLSRPPPAAPAAAVSNGAAGADALDGARGMDLT